MITILTDSVSDIPDNLLEKYNIVMVPLKVHFGEETYVDRQDLTHEEFFAKTNESEHFPKSSQPSPDKFQKVFTEETAKGNSIIGIFIALPFSGTIQSAELARNDFPDAKIDLIDSTSGTMLQGLLVIEAAKMAQAGKSHDEIVTFIESQLENKRSYMIVNNLDNLIKGGRMTVKEGQQANLLNIKPILALADEGVVKPLGKARGFNKGIQWVIDKMAEEKTDYTDTPLAIGYAVNKKAADNLVAQLEKKFKLGEVIVYKTGAVVGTHLGEGFVGVFYYI